MPQKLYITIFLTLFFGLSCSSYKTISTKFNNMSTPDYSVEKFWAALPSKENEAKRVPYDTLILNQHNIDVFFIHPTLFLKGKGWNADVNKIKLNKQVCKTAIRHQSTVFNGVGEIYAPHYRQAHIKSFFNLEQGGKEAILQAYTDVRKAFLYYLENYNKGNPFIIAGHSQGTLHAKYLLQEFIDTTELKNQLVAAYLIGMPINEEDFSNIFACNNSQETGCFVSWNSFQNNYYPSSYPLIFKENVVTNPISWTRDTMFSSTKDHKGILMKNFKTTHTECLEARCNNGILSVTRPKVRNPIFRVKNYHIGDYNLFWFNIRENANCRAINYLSLLEKNNGVFNSK